MSQPGIMVYFDLAETLKDFTVEEAGRLFLAMLEYGSSGVVPEFDDRAMRTVWRNVQQKIDRDSAKYQSTVEARQYATYCREFKRRNGEESKPLSLEAWKDQMTSNDNFHIQLQPQPVTITTTVTVAETGKGNGNGDTGEKERGNKEAEFERKRQEALKSIGFD